MYLSFTSMCTVLFYISIDNSNVCISQSFNHPHLIPWLKTHVLSLRNSNQDECEPTAWIIPGLISLCSQEQVAVLCDSGRYACVCVCECTYVCLLCEKKPICLYFVQMKGCALFQAEIITKLQK